MICISHERDTERVRHTGDTGILYGGRGAARATTVARTWGRDENRRIEKTTTARNKISYGREPPLRIGVRCADRRAVPCRWCLHLDERKVYDEKLRAPPALSEAAVRSQMMPWGRLKPT